MHNEQPDCMPETTCRNLADSEGRDNGVVFHRSAVIPHTGSAVMVTGYVLIVSARRHCRVLRAATVRKSLAPDRSGACDTAKRPDRGGIATGR